MAWLRKYSTCPDLRHFFRCTLPWRRPLKLSHESELTWLRLPGRSESLGRFQAFALACAQAQTASESLHTKIDLVLEEVLLNIFYYAFEEGSAGIVAVGCGMTQD